MENINKQPNLVWQWLYRLRGVILSLPVAIVALVLALRNGIKLPETVMFSTAAVKNGVLVFQNVLISRPLAIWGPFGITMLCLGMVLLSRRVFYPWIISLFTLVVPVLLLLVNTFP